MKTKKGKVILSISTFVISALSAGIGFGLLGDSELSSAIRMVYGCCFIWTPLLVIAMITTLFKK